jgi:hypothetical protein
VTIDVRPSPFASGISRDVEEMLKLARSALRQAEEARAALGPPVDTDPEAKKCWQRLRAVHAYLSYVSVDLGYAADVLRLLAARE